MPIAALILAFVLVLLLVTRRVALWISLSAAAITLGLVSGMSPGDLASSAAASLASPRTISLVLSVAAITTLAEVLKRYGLLAALVRSITCLLGRADLAVMAVPSIIGALPVQGGAILSAPMVDGLGSELGLGPKHKAAVNLIFRHVWYFIAPFSPSLILGAQLAGVELGRLILWHVPFTLAAVTVGYLVVVRGAARRSGPASPEIAEPAAALDPTAAPAVDPGAAGSPPGGVVSREPDGPAAPLPYPNKAAALVEFVRASSPLVVGVALSLGLGPVRLPLYASIGLGLVLALFFSRKHESFRSLGLPAVWDGLQWSILGAMAAVMVFSGVMADSGATSALVDVLVGSGLPSWVLMLVVPAAMGFIGGTPTVPVGISFPALLPLAGPGQVLAAAAVIYTSGFISYFVSPIHLCQILSMEYFGVYLPDLYRHYWPVVAATLGCSVTYIILFLA